MLNVGVDPCRVACAAIVLVLIQHTSPILQHMTTIGCMMRYRGCSKCRPVRVMKPHGVSTTGALAGVGAFDKRTHAVTMLMWSGVSEYLSAVSIAWCQCAYVDGSALHSPPAQNYCFGVNAVCFASRCLPHHISSHPVSDAWHLVYLLRRCKLSCVLSWYTTCHLARR
jgi:hypothetical protein